VNVKSHRRPDLRQTIKNVQWNKDLVADSADIDDDFTWHFVCYRPANLRNHDSYRMSLPPGPTHPLANYLTKAEDDFRRCTTRWPSDAASEIRDRNDSQCR
jgi:hypothetical protein